MARFYGELWKENNANMATKSGTEHAPVCAHVRGWDVGIEVQCSASGKDDVVDVYLTGGSNRSCADVFIGQARLQNGVPVFFTQGGEGVFKCEL